MTYGEAAGAQQIRPGGVWYIREVVLYGIEKLTARHMEGKMIWHSFFEFKESDGNAWSGRTGVPRAWRAAGSLRYLLREPRIIVDAA